MPRVNFVTSNVRLFRHYCIVAVRFSQVMIQRSCASSDLQRSAGVHHKHDLHFPAKNQAIHPCPIADQFAVAGLTPSPPAMVNLYPDPSVAQFPPEFKDASCLKASNSHLSCKVASFGTPLINLELHEAFHVIACVVYTLVFGWHLSPEARKLPGARLSGFWFFRYYTYCSFTVQHGLFCAEALIVALP